MAAPGNMKGPTLLEASGTIDGPDMSINTTGLLKTVGNDVNFNREPGGILSAPTCETYPNSATRMH